MNVKFKSQAILSMETKILVQLFILMVICFTLGLAVGYVW